MRSCWSCPWGFPLGTTAICCFSDDASNTVAATGSRPLPFTAPTRQTNRRNSVPFHARPDSSELLCRSCSNAASNPGHASKAARRPGSGVGISGCTPVGAGPVVPSMRLGQPKRTALLRQPWNDEDLREPRPWRAQKADAHRQTRLSTRNVGTIPPPKRKSQFGANRQPMVLPAGHSNLLGTRVGWKMGIGMPYSCGPPEFRRQQNAA